MQVINIHINRSSLVRCVNRLYGSAFSQASNAFGFDQLVSNPKYDTFFCFNMFIIFMFLIILKPEFV